MWRTFRFSRRLFVSLIMNKKNKLITTYGDLYFGLALILIHFEITKKFNLKYSNKLCMGGASFGAQTPAGDAQSFFA